MVTAYYREGIIIDGGGCLEVLLEPLLKGPYRFTYVLLITLQPVTFKTIFIKGKKVSL